MRRLFIIRKDLKLSAGKLAAMVGHCCEAYWTNWLKRHVITQYHNIFSCTASNPMDVRNGTQNRELQFYRHPDLYELSKKAFEQKKDYFLAHKTEDGKYIEDTELDTYYIVPEDTEIDKDIYEQYINGSFVKTICEAKNLNHLLKAIEKAQELGLQEGRDYGLINDNCYTELVPENEDGTCTVGLWFKPLNDEIAHAISKKYQLYKG